MKRTVDRSVSMAFASLISFLGVTAVWAQEPGPQGQHQIWQKLNTCEQRQNIQSERLEFLDSQVQHLTHQFIIHNERLQRLENQVQHLTHQFNIHNERLQHLESRVPGPHP